MALKAKDFEKKEVVKEEPKLENSKPKPVFTSNDDENAKYEFVKDKYGRMALKKVR